MKFNPNYKTKDGWFEVELDLSKLTNEKPPKQDYWQSDEITIVLVDYEKLDTEPFFEYRVDKLCSIAASMATMAFNKFFIMNTSYIRASVSRFDNADCLGSVYEKAVQKGLMFDCRCFNLPKEEVTNNLYWRQLDCSRNSIQMVGQANFSHKELQNKTCNMIQDMLMTQKGINWNDLPTYQKRGSCVVRNKIVVNSNGVIETAMLRDTTKSENEWIIDKEIPIFKGEGRQYIERLINF